MTPTVSVVIASYNYARYLPLAVGSALMQTVGDLEIVVVDDGSTDGTREVIRPLLSDPRVRYERIDHLGHAPAKNHGVRTARGEFVAFLDADDVWLPTKLERQLPLFSDSGVGVVYCLRSVIDEQGRPLLAETPRSHRGVVLEPLCLDNFICFSTAVVRRSIFDEVGPFDDSFVHPIDYEMWLRIALRYRFDYVDEPLTQWRRHINMSAKSTLIDRRDALDRIMDRFLDELGGRSRVRPAVLREAELLRCCTMGLAWRDRSVRRAAGWFLTALGQHPLYWAAWRNLAALCVPEPGRRLIRRAWGRPSDWKAPRPAGPATV